MSSSHRRRGWLVDGHVHLHACFDVGTLLAAAANHFATAARRLGLPESTPGCLLLVETAAYARFRELRDRGLAARDGWAVRSHGEAASVLAEHAGGARIVFVAGRQIATRERLEVLSIGCDDPVPDGQPIRRVLERVSTLGALPIIPCGFGKWWFGRGRLVEDLLTAPPVPTLLLGDNGGRWRGAPTPRPLRLGQARGVWNIPGSDPLPLPHQVDRVGSYGSYLPCTPDLGTPARQIQELLRAGTEQPAVFGRRQSLPRFLRAQVGVRVRR